jgi:hypothetical protein
MKVTRENVKIPTQEYVQEQTCSKLGRGKVCVIKYSRKSSGNKNFLGITHKWKNYIELSSLSWQEVFRNRALLNRFSISLI